MIRPLVRLAYPTEAELRRLVERETDPRCVAAFAPLHLGPALTIVALVAVLLCGALLAPLRIARRVLGR